MSSTAPMHSGVAHTFGLNYKYDQNIIFKAEYEKGAQLDISDRSKISSLLAEVDFAF